MSPLAEPRPASGSMGWRTQAPHGAAAALLWLAMVFGALLVLRLAQSGAELLLDWLLIAAGMASAVLAIPLGLALVRTRLLWSLRNKLILTYLLIGLAPAVLLLILVGVSAYIAAGQFSIHLADTRMHQELDQIGLDNAAHVERLARVLRLQQEGELAPDRFRRRPPPARRSPMRTAPAAETPAPTAAPAVASQPLLLGETTANPLLARLHRHTDVYLNGAPYELPMGPPGSAAPAERAPAAQVPLGLPPWAADLRGHEFRGLVIDGDDLFLVAVDQRRIGGKGLLSVVTSLPVNSALVDVVAQGLGRVRLTAITTVHPSAASTHRASLITELQRSSVLGGTEPQSVNMGDLRVAFPSTLDVTDWAAGQADDIPIEVLSRPSLLYRQLFGSSLGGLLTIYYRDGLAALCILFALIEGAALWMALRLSRTITASVHELYTATQYVDRGIFAHRIAAVVTSEQDQLGELARSFNRMTGSLERLLVEQKEKERLQSELSIAQEVQANLFPHHARNLPNLELHGICRPARSVSGDYYDFLVFHHRDQEDQSAAAGRESGVGILLGDISGKGISAALLMATLHSAVRAYRFASEDLIYSDRSLAGLAFTRNGDGDTGKLFESPARILSLLNRHLYRSTQPEKYATLFLAHYDAASAQLTYSTAGQLPPFILGLDNSIRRLDCGGTVVGLMDGISYEEGHVQMHPGDILIAYSDGVTEPENDFGDFGETRLLEVVARYRDEPLHVISAQVMLALDAWIGAAEQPDDITLVLARQL